MKPVRELFRVGTELQEQRNSQQRSRIPSSSREQHSWRAPKGTVMVYDGTKLSVSTAASAGQSDSLRPMEHIRQGLERPSVSRSNIQTAFLTATSIVFSCPGKQLEAMDFLHILELVEASTRMAQNIPRSRRWRMRRASIHSSLASRDEGDFSMLGRITTRWDQCRT